MRYQGVVATLLLSLTLSGCAISTAPTPRPDSAQDAAPVTYTPGELNQESLFELLAAEIAGQKRQFDTALGYYLHQAEMTGDAAVAERATRIAQFLRDTDAVLSASRIWAQADPETLEPLHIQLHMLMAAERFDEAFPIFKALLATAEGEDSIEPVLLVATYSPQLSTQNLVAYEGELARVAAVQPQRLDIMMARALLKRRLGDDSGALALLNQGLALEPGHSDLALQKVEILRQQGETEAALRTLNTALRVNPGEKHLRIQQVQLLLEDQPRQALGQIRRLLADYPDDSQMQYYFALLLLDHDRPEESRALLASLLEQNPDNSNLHFYLALIEERLNNDSAALEHYLEVNEGDNLQQAYVRALGLLDDPQSAPRVERIIAEGIQRHPELDTPLTLLLAEWLHRHGKTESALKLLDERLQQSPHQADLLYSRALLLGDTDPQRMLADLELALRLEPENPMIQNALGYSLAVHTNDHERAHLLISRALEQRPNDAAILDSMGWVLYKLGRTGEALNFLRRAQQTFPDPEVSAHLIEVLWATGAQKEARQLLQQQRQEHPDNVHLKAVAETLGEQP